MFENQELPNISKSTWANKEEGGKLTAIRESIFSMLLSIWLLKNIEKMPFYNINNIFSVYMEYKYMMYDI